MVGPEVAGPSDATWQMPWSYGWKLPCPGHNGCRHAAFQTLGLGWHATPGTDRRGRATIAFGVEDCFALLPSRV